MPEDWLPDQLRTCRNLLDIALLLVEVDKRELLPTVLELLFQEVQGILDAQCIKHSSEPIE